MGSQPLELARILHDLHTEVQRLGRADHDLTDADVLNVLTEVMLVLQELVARADNAA